MPPDTVWTEPATGHPPFGLSPSQTTAPFGLSLSKPFDPLRANGLTLSDIRKPL